jgi:hypothetical protein
MSDPLSLLREQFINKKPVTHDATHIFIGDLKFQRGILTAYKQDRGSLLYDCPSPGISCAVTFLTAQTKGFGAPWMYGPETSLPLCAFEQVTYSAEIFRAAYWAYHHCASDDGLRIQHFCFVAGSPAADNS